jgi:hypothetical protein
MAPIDPTTLANPETIPFVLGRIEGKLELVLARLDTKDKEVSDRFQRTEDRIARLESKASRAFGIGAGLAFAGSLVVMVLKYALGAHL